MPQSSLTAWLNQPQAVKKSPNEDERRMSTSAPQQQAPSPRQEEEESRSNEAHRAARSLLSLSGSLKPLPPNVELRPCTKEDIPHLKRLTSLLLPIPYPEKFYKEIIEDETTAGLTLLAVWHDDCSKRAVAKGRLVGAIRCRLLNELGQSSSNSSPILYLSTLVLLSPFRSHGIATHLLHTLIRRAVDKYGVSGVGAHVWVANTEAFEWYRKRGFKEVGREPGYYRRLDPQDAIIVQRDVRVSDHVAPWIQCWNKER